MLCSEESEKRSSKGMLMCVCEEVRGMRRGKRRKDEHGGEGRIEERIRRGKESGIGSS